MPYLSDFMGDRPRPRCRGCCRVRNHTHFTLALSGRRCDDCVRSAAADAINRMHNSGERAA